MSNSDELADKDEAYSIFTGLIGDNTTVCISVFQQDEPEDSGAHDYIASLDWLIEE